MALSLDSTYHNIYYKNVLTKIRDIITNELIYKINSSFSDIDAIAGVATAGIPQAAYVAKAKFGVWACFWGVGGWFVTVCVHVWGSVFSLNTLVLGSP